MTQSCSIRLDPVRSSSIQRDPAFPSSIRRNPVRFGSMKLDPARSSAPRRVMQRNSPTIVAVFEAAWVALRSACRACVRPMVESQFGNVVQSVNFRTDVYTNVVYTSGRRTHHGTPRRRQTVRQRWQPGGTPAGGVPRHISSPRSVSATPKATGSLTLKMTISPLTAGK